MVELKVCTVDEGGLERTVFKTEFTYFFDQKAFMADMMFQCTLDGMYGLFPPLSSADDVRDFDLYLVDALSEVEVPEGWSMVGTTGVDGKLINSVEGMHPWLVE